VKIVALIQARLKSKRLPGKVLLPIRGLSVLQIIWHAVGECRMLDDARICVPFNDCQEIAGRIVPHGNVFAADIDENDVAGRLLQHCHENGTDHIVRICADSPFMHPALIDRVVAEHVSSGNDVSQLMGMPAGEQPQVYRVEALRAAYPKMTPQQKEHVIVNPMPRASVNHKIKLTIDTREDYDRLREKYEALPTYHWKMTWPELFREIR
jgi:spore coat polysaccharide biosynthesis protein SpsF